MNLEELRLRYDVEKYQDLDMTHFLGFSRSPCCCALVTFHLEERTDMLEVAAAFAADESEHYVTEIDPLYGVQPTMVRLLPETRFKLFHFMQDDDKAFQQAVVEYDRSTILSMVRTNSNHMEIVHRSTRSGNTTTRRNALALQDDIDVIRACISKTSWAFPLAYASDRLRDDRGLATEAILACPFNIVHVSDRLKADLVDMAGAAGYLAASDKYIKNRQYTLKCVEQGLPLHRVLHEAFLGDVEIVRAAVSNRAGDLPHAKGAACADRSIAIMAALGETTHTWPWQLNISERLQKDWEIKALLATEEEAAKILKTLAKRKRADDVTTAALARLAGRFPSLAAQAEEIVARLESPWGADGPSKRRKLDTAAFCVDFS